MASQVLLQRQPEEDSSRETSTPVQATITESKVINISIGNTRIEANTHRGRPFEFDVDLSELGRKGETVRIGFRLSFGRKSEGQSCSITGEAVVRLSHLSPEVGLQNLAPEITNQMAVSLFRRYFELTYLLHGSMGMQAPSPWITQDVALSLCEVATAIEEHAQ